VSLIRHRHSSGDVLQVDRVFYYCDVNYSKQYDWLGWHSLQAHTHYLCVLTLFSPRIIPIGKVNYDEGIEQPFTSTFYKVERIIFTQRPMTCSQLIAIVVGVRRSCR
jgi:hypothetical protein